MDIQEVTKLLKHPNPRERALALKLKTATPYDLAQGVLDPDPTVFQSAFNNKNATYALSILASRTRDVDGNPLFDRHDLLLKDPRLTKDHMQLMADAVKRDAKLPIRNVIARLSALASMGFQDINKRETWAHNLLFAGSNQNLGRVVNHEKETPQEHLKPIKQAYESAQSEAMEPHSAGLHGVGQVSPKMVYHVGDHKFMVKPYQEEENPLSGFSEASSSALYSTAGLGHLHQPSFVSSHGEGKYKIPATVIKLDTEALPIHKAPLGSLRGQNPALDDEGRKIALMDFLTGNRDRHAGNLMVQKNGHLLAIDHARAFDAQPTSLNYHINKGGITTLLGPPEPHRSAYQDLIKTWWPQVASKVKESFNSRVSNIEHPTHKQRVREAFNKRAAWLDAGGGSFNDVV
jgi:hypothetical protein